MNTLRKLHRLTTNPFSVRLSYCCFSQQRALQGNAKLKEEAVAADKKPVWYYDNKAIRKRKIDQLIRNAAIIQTHSVDNSNNNNNKNIKNTHNLVNHDEIYQTKRIIDLLKEDFEFTNKDIRLMLLAKPKLLQLSKSKLKKRLTGFVKLDLPLDVIRKMVLTCPSILLVDQDKMSLQKRLNNLQELALHPRLSQERCLYLVQKTPHILLIGEKANLVEKVQNLQQVGFNHQQIFELVMKHPALLTYSKNTVKEKVNFLTEKINGRLALFVKFPRVLTASMKRLEERHQYLHAEGFLSEHSRLTENKLRAIVLTNDSDFVYRVTNSRMKDFRQFQKDFEQQMNKKEKEKEANNVEEDKEEAEDI